MTWLKHKNCTTPIVEYVGAVPYLEYQFVKRADFKFAENIEYSEMTPHFICPDCGKRVFLRAWNVEASGESEKIIRDWATGICVG